VGGAQVLGLAGAEGLDRQRVLALSKYGTCGGGMNGRAKYEGAWAPGMGQGVEGAALRGLGT